jgi:hypoxanthine phosphoribosyltransferase
MESGDEVPELWASEVSEVLLGSESIARRVRDLGEALTADYAGLNPILVVVLKGSFMFAGDLTRVMCTPHELAFIRAKSYVGTESSGNVAISGLDGVDLAGRHVIIVEDIVDTGLTLTKLIKSLCTLRPASVKVCTLLLKITTRRKADSPDVDYVAFTVPDKFVVGYGLDVDQRLRHLPFVGVMKEPEESSTTGTAAEVDAASMAH